MDLKKIMTISGYPGLFRHISQGRSGIIVESLTDKKRMQTYATMKVSALEDISVFTEDAEMPLKSVLKRIYEKESGKSCLNPKSSPEQIKNYFAEILPEYNKEKVYISDIKKILNWYNLLNDLNLLEFEESGTEDAQPPENPEAETGEKDLDKD